MIHCKNCGKEIKYKEDANVLAFLGFVPKYFCNNCYSSKERGFARHFIYFPRQPINSKIYVVGLWVITIILILLAIMGTLSIEVSNDKLSNLIFIIVLVGWTFILIWHWILYFMTKRKLSELK